MDYRSQLARFLDRRVCVEVWGRSTVWGTLVSIDEDHLRLVDTIILGELEGQGWFEQMQYAQRDSVAGPRNAETIFRFDVVLHVTCTDDDLPEPIEAPANKPASEPPVTVSTNRLEIEIGCNLLPLAQRNHGVDFLSYVGRVRKELADEMGVIIPKVRIKDRLTLQESSYRIRINGHTADCGTLQADSLQGKEWSEPVRILLTHFVNVVRRRLPELLGYQDVLGLVRDLRGDHGNAIDALIPGQVSVSLLQRILQSLLEEQVSIRHLMTIIESVAYHSLQNSDHDQLLQRLRVDIGRDICAPFLNEEGQLRCIRLDESIEENFSQQTPQVQQALLLAFVRSIQPVQDRVAILVRRTETRRAIFASLSGHKDHLAIIATAEIPHNIVSSYF
jgi:flagellar biosynthesis protein FlhA